MTIDEPTSARAHEDGALGKLKVMNQNESDILREVSMNTVKDIAAAILALERSALDPREIPPAIWRSPLPTWSISTPFWSVASTAWRR